jgi:1-acyl-sn-glycerol-3-phosphate acyltransferase
VAAFCTVTLGVVIYILAFQKNDRLTYFFMRLWALVLFYGAGFRYSLKFSEKLNKNQNYIIVANHTSLMDVALMYIVHPQHPIVFVGKKELQRYPVFGRIYSKVSILVDRSDRKSREAVYPAVKEKLGEGKNVVIFAEGTVPDRDVILGKFKDGAFAFSTLWNVPIVVYVVHNLKNMFPFVSTLGYPGKVQVEQLAILRPDGETIDSMKEKTFKMMFHRLENDKIEFPEIK